ncbi:MAG: hypothetical protein IPH41_15360 [Sulfuritalea sp.]|nr:hypothetical protein [Sulfuritalea sp.]
MIHGGQTVELHSPDFELRVNVLRDKAEQERSPLGNDVLRFIAKNLSTNIRELEGALNTVVAYSRFHGKDISLAVASSNFVFRFSIG